MTGDLDLGDGVIIRFEGTTANDFETTLTVTDPTADRTVTIPDATGHVFLTDSAITPSANIQSLLGAADYAAMRTQLDLEDGDIVGAINSAEALDPVGAVDLSGASSVTFGNGDVVEDAIEDGAVSDAKANLFAEADVSDNSPVTATNIDWLNSGHAPIDLEDATGDVTLTMINLQVGKVYQLYVTQDSTARDVILQSSGASPAVSAFGGGGTVDISTGEDDVDLILFVYDGTQIVITGIVPDLG